MPSGIEGITTRMPEAAQTGHVPVMKAGGMQGRRQFTSIELRIVPRTRDGAYINQALYLVCFQKMDELLRRACGVSDGQDNQLGSQVP